MDTIYRLAISISRPSSLPDVDTSQAHVDQLIVIALRIFGAVAVVAITFGGLKYILSKGDPQATLAAKNIIFYALVGIAVSVMAQAIMAFVFNRVIF